MSTSPDPIREQLIEARRNQILDAAAAVFAEKGFHRATTKQIAKTAGVSMTDILNVGAISPKNSFNVGEFIVIKGGKSIVKYLFFDDAISPSELFPNTSILCSPSDGKGIVVFPKIVLLVFPSSD